MRHVCRGTAWHFGWNVVLRLCRKMRNPAMDKAAHQFYTVDITVLSKPQQNIRLFLLFFTGWPCLSQGSWNYWYNWRDKSAVGIAQIRQISTKNYNLLELATHFPEFSHHSDKARGSHTHTIHHQPRTRIQMLFQIGNLPLLDNPILFLPNTKEIIHAYLNCVIIVHVCLLTFS